jgi:hypothetical protein
MMESAADFGTGLRAHLGLEQAELELVASPTAEPEPLQARPSANAHDPWEQAALDALAELESELHERERGLARRETSLAARAGALLATAQALYDEVLGGGPSPNDDELARLRRRKSMA